MNHSHIFRTLTGILASTLLGGIALAATKLESRKAQEAQMKRGTEKLVERCGCPGPRFIVDWSSFPRAVDMEKIVYPIGKLNEMADHVCSAELKEAWCAWTKDIVYKIHFTTEPGKQGTRGSTFNVSSDGKTYDCGSADWEQATPCPVNKLVDNFLASH